MRSKLEFLVDVCCWFCC